MGRSRKPLWLSGHRGFESHALRHWQGQTGSRQQPVRDLSRSGNGHGTWAWHRAGMATTAALPTASIGVSVLSWPGDAQVRQHLAAFGQPRILLVDEGSDPPLLLDELEDWVRSPANPADLEARSRELCRRAVDAVPESPTIDDHGLLWVGRRWVDLTPAQAPVVELLLEHLERVVAYDTIGAVYERAGGSNHSASLRTLLTRIGGRVRPLGLGLVTVRRRGVLLTQRPASPASPAASPRAGGRSAACA